MAHDVKEFLISSIDINSHTAVHEKVLSYFLVVIFWLAKPGIVVTSHGTCI